MRRFLALTSLILMTACTGTAPTNDAADGTGTTTGSNTPLLSMDDLMAQAESGNVEAMFSLGASYDDGIDVAKDPVKAREWYQKAADKGHVQAQFNMGVLYYNGEGVTQDWDKARGYFQKSADAQDMRAQFNLGVMAYRGEAMTQDFQKALDLFQKSALQGMPDAAYNLAVMYVRGEGLAKSDVLALAWFKIAADLGDDKAPLAIAEASKNIPDDMIPQVDIAYRNIRSQINATVLVD